MSYTSLTFAVFAVITVVIYYLTDRRFQWVILLAASVIFYLWAGYRYAFYLLGTLLSVFFGALWMEHIAQKRKEKLAPLKESMSRDERRAYKAATSRRRAWVLAGILVLNFGVLVFLKYFNFISGSLGETFGFVAPQFSLVLPLGISFYTFQAAAYAIDVYRETVSPERNFAKFTLYLSFFPQVVQGPIGNYSKLAPQLTAAHEPEFENFRLGGELILWGLFKKLVIADRAAPLIQTVTAGYTSYNGAILLFTVLLYALQLYADFSGGIDISRGVAKVLGIDLGLNFRQPYFSRTLTEYWQRWHISLGEWMKTYLFYPLAMSKAGIGLGTAIGKSRFGKTAVGKHLSRTLASAITSLIVFLVVGLWHGASDKYVAFGLWNGLILMLSTLLKPVFESVNKALHVNTESWHHKLFQMLRTFLLVLIGYYFDIAPDAAGALDMMRRSVTDWGSVTLKFFREALAGLGLHTSDLIVLAFSLVIIWVNSLICERKNAATPGEWMREKPVAEWILVYLIAILVVVVGCYGPGYDAAEFVYMQF